VVHSRIMAKKRKIETEVRMAAEGEASCPVRMGYSEDDPICGRILHVAPEGIDERPVCLMHSKDPDKQSGALFDAFWREFERILETAGEGEAHFERFVFPRLDFRGREFQAICRFNGASFTQKANFQNAIFIHDAFFHNTTFTKSANFRDATFTHKAIFVEATFTLFANFHNATFTQTTNLNNATFAQIAGFRNATFAQIASFHDTTFTEKAFFNNAIFSQKVDFTNATFTQAADFTDTQFHGTADWRWSQFLEQAEFRYTKFLPKTKRKPSAIFSLTKFSKPSDVVFNDVDLSRVIFHDCDVSQFKFTSSVRWGKRKGNRGFSIYEETIDLEQEFAEELKKEMDSATTTQSSRSISS